MMLIPINKVSAPNVFRTPFDMAFSIGLFFAANRLVSQKVKLPATAKLTNKQMDIHGSLPTIPSRVLATT